MRIKGGRLVRATNNDISHEEDECAVLLEERDLTHEQHNSSTHGCDGAARNGDAHGAEGSLHLLLPGAILLIVRVQEVDGVVHSQPNYWIRKMHSLEPSSHGTSG